MSCVVSFDLFSKGRRTHHKLNQIEVKLTTHWSNSPQSTHVLWWVYNFSLATMFHQFFQRKSNKNPQILSFIRYISNISSKFYAQVYSKTVPKKTSINNTKSFNNAGNHQNEDQWNKKLHSQSSLADDPQKQIQPKKKQKKNHFPFQFP